MGYLRCRAVIMLIRPEFRCLNVMSYCRASILGVVYLIPMIYFLSFAPKYGALARPNPGERPVGVANAIAATHRNFKRFRL